MVEAIVGQTSRYILRPIRDLDLLARYGIHLSRCIGATPRSRRSAGLPAAGRRRAAGGGTPAQIQRFCDNGDPFPITEGRQMASRRHKAPVALTIVGVMLLAALNVMPIEGLALIGGDRDRHRLHHQRRGLQVDRVADPVLIFGMLAISIAMRNSGLDQHARRSSSPRSARACRRG